MIVLRPFLKINPRWHLKSLRSIFQVVRLDGARFIPPMVTSCLIIGAGISGLLAARELSSRGVNITILEKSRGVGGRMATRRSLSGIYDHGAQFLTARDPAFVEITKEWRSLGLLETWSHGFQSETGKRSGDERPRYSGAGGMTAVPKHLAYPLNVLLNQRVSEIVRSGGMWTARTVEALSFTAEALILTCPLPQALALIESPEPLLARDIREQLGKIRYNSCVALLVGLDGPSRVPPPGGLALGPEPVRWLADNQQKGISPDATTLTVHAGPKTSAGLMESTDIQVAETLLSAVRQYIGSNITETIVHRWKYAEPTMTFPSRTLTVATGPPLLIAGDAFGGPSVEGAALSGIASAEALVVLAQKRHKSSRNRS